MPRAKNQKAVSDPDVIRLYEEAGCRYKELVDEGKKHSEAKRQALSEKFVGQYAIKVESAESKAIKLHKEKKIATLWHKKKRQTAPGLPDLPIETGQCLVTYHQDPGAAHGVYYTVVLDDITSREGEVCYIGKADADTYGWRLLANTKYEDYSTRIPVGKTKVIENRCLVPSKSVTDVVCAENVITRCWALLTCRLPSLHTIDSNIGKDLALTDLSQIDLRVIEDALKHLASVGQLHECQLWQATGRGPLDLTARSKHLLETLRGIRLSVRTKTRIPRITGGKGGKGRDIAVAYTTSLGVAFDNSDVSQQWLTDIILPDTFATDTVEGQRLKGLLVKAGTAAEASEAIPSDIPNLFRP